MAEHTPGPWRIVGERPEGLVVMTERRNDSVIVAIAPGPYRGRIDAETQATAHLVAAAPELLAIAREWLAIWNSPRNIDRIVATCGILDRTEAVITRAAGITSAPPAAPA